LDAPERVKALIDFGMEQLTWVHPKTLVSQTIIEQMKRSTYTHENRPKALGYSKSIGRCAKYVKIALWKAGYIPSDGDFDPGTSSASKLGPGLLRAGFSDVTASLPDARWAAPGDVIVYQKIGAPDADGHIDIRTYDGYLSDFWDSYLPVSVFNVIGVYRKYFDPLPEKRLKAFLKVIRSREAETLFMSQGDAAAYRALPMSSFPRGTPPQMFDNFKDHPYAAEALRRPSGAYGITVDSWKRILAKWVSVPDGADRFSPVVQDRIAVALMDLHPGIGYGTAGYQTTRTTSLGMVRLGRIEDAARQLSTINVQWSSLPGGSETRKYSMERMLGDYQKYLDELS
jgi:muramidase (phage lysozyme)